MRTKVEKKVKEAHRKQKKASKKTAELRKNSNAIPVKSLVNKYESEEQVLQAMAQGAEQRSEMHCKKVVKPVVKAPVKAEGSQKSYYKEFCKVVEEADVILEVLDARDPIGCRAKQVEQMVLESGKQKRIVLILNKIDLIPKDVLELWLKYLRNEYPTVAFKSSTQTQRSNLGQNSAKVESANVDLMHGGECLGADDLIQLLKNYCRNSKMKTSITVGIVGYPNVGKSSLINSLKRSKVCNVGSTPGITKSSQLVTLDKNIKLLDSPGIIFSSSEDESTMLRNCVRVEQLSDPISPVETVLSRCKPESLMLIYNIPTFKDVAEFLALIARQHGKLTKGGIPDTNAAAKIVLHDWNSGKIPFYTLPPESTSVIQSTVVTEWSKEFDLNAAMDVDVTLLEPSDTLMQLDQSDPKMIIGTNLKKKKTANERQEPVMTALEMELNPQSNKKKKKTRKLKVCDAEEFDFNDFTPLPSAK